MCHCRDSRTVVMGHRCGSDPAAWRVFGSGLGWGFPRAAGSLSLAPLVSLAPHRSQRTRTGGAWRPSEFGIQSGQSESIPEFTRLRRRQPGPVSPRPAGPVSGRGWPLACVVGPIGSWRCSVRRRGARDGAVRFDVRSPRGRGCCARERGGCFRIRPSGRWGCGGCRCGG